MTDPLVGLRPSRVSATVPWWYERLVGALASAVVGFGLVGMALALIGWFRIGPGIALGSAASYSIFAQWFRASPRRSSSWRVTVPAVVATAIAVSSLFFNWTAAAEPLLADGEPGVMVIAARHLNVTGSLSIEASVGPFAEARVGFVTDGLVGSGVGGHLDTAVPHLAAIYRGIGGWFGWTPLLAIGALLGAAALLSFYRFATQLIHPAIALVPTAALALSLPFVQAARGAYPELVGMLAIFAGLGLLGGLSQFVDPWRGAIAGMLLGMPVLARPEWAVLIIPFGVFVAYGIARSAEQSWLGSRARRRFLLAMTAGFAVPALVAAADATRSGLGTGANFDPRRAATIIAVAAVLFGTVRLTGRLLGEQPRFAYADIRRGFAYLIAGALLVGAAASMVRPVAIADEPSTAVGQAQAIEGVGIDPFRTYDESTGLWAVWYLGPVSVIAGTIGLALLIVDVSDDPGRRTLLFLLLALVGSFAVVVDAGPEPVQIMASRRLLLITIPALLIGAGVVARKLYDDAPRYVTRGTIVMAVGLAAVVVVPGLHLRGVADLSDHRGTRAGIDEACALFDRRDVVLFAETGAAAPGAVAGQTVRDFCRIPAARAFDPTPAEIESLTAAWAAEGRRLIVVSAEPWPGLLGGDRLEISWRGLERTVESRPDGPGFGALVLYATPAR